MLARGFALVRDADGAMLRRAAEVRPACALDIEFADGHVGAHADASERKPEPTAKAPRSRRRKAGLAALARAGQIGACCADGYGDCRLTTKEATGHSALMNRFERNLGFKGEAKLKYLDGEVQVLTPGDFVRCAVTGRTIPLDELRYWSVELQEAYVDAAASLKRFRELNGHAKSGPSSAAEASVAVSATFAKRFRPAASRFGVLELDRDGERARAVLQLGRRALSSSSGSRTQSFSVVTSMAFSRVASVEQAAAPGARYSGGGREGARIDQPRAVVAQRGEEFLGPGDAGEADHRQHAEPAPVLARHHARLEHRLALRARRLR